MKDIQQLIKQNEDLGYENIYPKSYIDAITDKESGMALEDILNSFNMYFLSYNGNTSATRCSVPIVLRKKGLWITYVKYDGNVYTEWYAANKIDDKSWGDSSNWRIGSNMLQGDISISANGNWVIDGKETSFKALGEQGNSPKLRIYNNKWQVTYNDVTWFYIAESPVFTQFKFTKVEGNENIGKILSSVDNGKTWQDLSPTFTTNLYIKGYVATTNLLPSSAALGDIYGVGPNYDSSDSEHTNPKYTLYVKNGNEWKDNGNFTSISVGVVLELGNSNNLLVSLKAITDFLYGIHELSSATKSAFIQIPNKNIEDFNIWLNSVNFALDSKYLGRCKALVGSRNIEIYNYVLAYNTLGILVVSGTCDINEENKLYLSNTKYKILYRLYSLNSFQKWQDFLDSSNIFYNNSLSKLNANTVKKAIDKLLYYACSYNGNAYPKTIPPKDIRSYYTANTIGTYENFDNIKVTKKGINILRRLNLEDSNSWDLSNLLSVHGSVDTFSDMALCINPVPNAISVDNKIEAYRNFWVPLSGYYNNITFKNESVFIKKGFSFIYNGYLKNFETSEEIIIVPTKGLTRQILYIPYDSLAKSSLNKEDLILTSEFSNVNDIRGGIILASWYIEKLVNNGLLIEKQIGLYSYNSIFYLKKAKIYNANSLLNTVIVNHINKTITFKKGTPILCWSLMDSGSSDITLSKDCVVSFDSVNTSDNIVYTNLGIIIFNRDTKKFVNVAHSYYLQYMKKDPAWFYIGILRKFTVNRNAIIYDLDVEYDEIKEEKAPPEESNKDSIITRNFFQESIVELVIKNFYNVGHKKPFVIMQTSDVHKDETRWKNANKYLKYKIGIDALVCNGDITQLYYTDDIKYFYNNLTDIPCFLTLGNHEVWKSGLATNTDIYNKYYLPLIQKYGSNYINNENNTIWYFKDFESYNIRLISLFEYDAPIDLLDSNNTSKDRMALGRWLSLEQIDWFVKTLKETPDNFSVIIATHQTPLGSSYFTLNEVTPIKPWTAENLNLFLADDKFMDSTESTYKYGSIICDIVQAFIDKKTINKNYNRINTSNSTINVIGDFTLSKGEFICYLCGHSHSDGIFTFTKYPKQHTISVTSTYGGYSRTSLDKMARANYGLSLDAINIISFDTNKKIVQIARVGCNIAENFLPRNYVQFNYSKEIQEDSDLISK